VTVVDASADHVEASLDAGPTPLDLIVFGPIRSVNIFEETLERVAYTIKSGIYPPGTRLPSERELAARLEVSRATLREVNRALEQAGYVELRRGRTGGAFVLERPIEASREQARRVAREMGDQLPAALDYRWAVEPAAAALAALRADDSGVRQLEERHAECLAVSGRAYRGADVRFHGQVALLARSPTIAAAVTGIQQELSDLFSVTPVVESVLRHSDDQHAAIVSAIKSGDAGASRAAMEEHVKGTEAFLRAFLT
jgi:GntR family transcriptional repressor for pyruvate dehydrogenase complex